MQGKRRRSYFVARFCLPRIDFTAHRARTSQRSVRCMKQRADIPSPTRLSTARLSKLRDKLTSPPGTGRLGQRK
jgi:hypothetical protein